ncbi:MAG: hypothetical protein QXP17_02795, partial [Candidatus Jordarchaeales archaeon]
YVRSRELVISRRVVPSIPNKVSYFLRAILSMKKPGTREEEWRLSSEKPVTLLARVFAEATPVSMNIKGMSFSLEKDTFKPGEEIKLKYSVQNVRTMKVDLIHESNITCACPRYKTVCAYVKRHPKEKVLSVEELNPGSGVVTIKIPAYAEPSYNYLWEPPEVTFWSLVFGAYSRWYLEVECLRTSGESVMFQIPINVVTEERVVEKIFEEAAEKAKPFKPLDPHSIVISVKREDSKVKFIVKNVSSRVLKGVTVRVNAIKEELFEVKPYVYGIAELLPNEEKSFDYNVQAEKYQVTLEDNEGNIIVKHF